jgi:spore maturation protein SpmA
MKIGEKGGIIDVFARLLSPIFTKLFPDIPKGHPVTGSIFMNISANMLGLDNAATPLGLKAMKGLQELNPNKKEASNAQIMFLALNTSGLTLIPITILAQRSVLGAADPTDIFIPLLLSTFISTVAAIIYVGIKQHLNLCNKVVISWLVGISTVIGLMMYGFSRLNQEEMIMTSKIVSNALLFTIIITFIGGAAYKKVNVYECFIEGAKQGFETSIKVMPYLVGMLVAIGVFRASGAMDYLMYGLKWLWSWTSLNTDFVDALPVAIMKPLSGSGAKAMMVETMQTFGVDSFTGKLSCLFQGAADTTFYIVALYFGSVGIRKTRYAVTAGLVADTVGAIAAIFIAYYFFR